jgi:hypothetical protein
MGLKRADENVSVTTWSMKNVKWSPVYEKR